MNPSAESPGTTGGEDAPPKTKSRRRGFKRFLIWATATLGLFLLLLVALVVFRNPILRSVAKANIRQATGLDVDIETLEIGFRSVSLNIEGFVLQNPPGFGDRPLLELPELYVQLDPVGSQSNRLAFEEIRFHLASLNIVSDQSGHLNLEALTNAPSEHRPRTSGGRNPEFGGIGKLSLKIGKLTFTDLAEPANGFEVLIDLDSEVTGLNTAQDVTNWFGGLVTRQALAQLLDPSKSRHQRSLWRRLLKLNGTSTPSKELSPPPLSP